MDGIITTLSQRLVDLIENNASEPRKRLLIALAGTPGSGKTTLSAALTKSFNSKRNQNVTVLPMDGFHYPKSVLSTMKTTECPFQRRGAPFTFDGEAFVKLVKRLRNTPVTELDDPALSIYAPSFDHALKDPIENDIYISSAQRILILEGNYLLMNERPWNQIQELVDETWYVSVPRETAKRRLIKRHLMAGIEATEEAAEMRAEGNDLLNADLIVQKMIHPDVTIQSIELVPAI